MRDMYFSGIHLQECQNGFMLDVGGGDGECCRGTRYVFNTRKDLANWILKDMKLAAFENFTDKTDNPIKH